MAFLPIYQRQNPPYISQSYLILNHTEYISTALPTELLNQAGARHKNSAVQLRGHFTRVILLKSTFHVVHYSFCSVRFKSLSPFTRTKYRPNCSHSIDRHV